MAGSVFKAFEDEIIKVSEFLPFDLEMRAMRMTR